MMKTYDIVRLLCWDRWFRYILLLLSIALLGGCVGGTWQLKPFSPGTPSVARCVANSQTFVEATLIASTEPTHEPTQPVSALAFSPDASTLHVIHAGDPGTLLTWDMQQTPQVTRQVTLEQLGQRGAHFNAMADYLVVVSGRMRFNPAFNRYGSNLKGVQIWDVLGGKLLHHFYNDPEQLPRPSVIANAALSPDSRLFLLAEGGGYDLREVDTGKGGLTQLNVIDEMTYESTAVAFDDATGEYFAYGAENGEVEVIQMLDNEGGFDSTAFFSRRDDGLPIAIAFHPTEPRLAVLREKSLQIGKWFKLGSLAGKVVPREESLIGDVEFSPDGRLLAVATPQGLQLREHPGFDLVASDDGYSATTLAFSQKECLLAVGDSEGNVHVYDLQP